MTIRVVGNPGDALPEPFDYVKNIHITSYVPLYKLDPQRNVCCDCTDNCSDKTKCQCWIYNIQRYEIFFGKKTNVHKFGYEFARLYMQVVTGIFECHDGCKCSKQCFNRVAQQPLGHRFEIFKTERYGYGLRCLNDLPNGAFIGCYMGDMISDDRAEQLADAKKDSYFYDIHRSGTPENKNRGQQMHVQYKPFVMDARLRGNFTKFLNVSPFFIFAWNFISSLVFI